MTVQEETLQVGDVLDGRYRIVSDGKDSDIGLDYKSYDMHRDQLVVVTLLDRRLGSGVIAVERLALVQETLVKLNAPGLQTYQTVGEIKGQLFFIRNHIEGRSLADLSPQVDRLTMSDLTKQSGSLGLRKAVNIAVHLCEVLAPAHRAGLVHGGLTPYSVLVGQDDQVTVLDTGILSALRPDPAPPGLPWGRFPYISPEQAAGENIQPASDVYAIGLLMYELLAGRPPFRYGDESMMVLQHLRYDPPSLQVLVPDAPLQLAQIVHKALAKEPSARYRNAGQLAHILRSQFGLQKTPAPVMVAAPPPTKEERQLVVPPPPIRQAERRSAPRPDTQDWAEESGGVDWLLIGLLAAALVAILGLIPLWRAVYRRYEIPSSPPSSRLYQLVTWEKASPLSGVPILQEAVLGQVELDDLGIVRYNTTMVRRTCDSAAVAGMAQQPGLVLAAAFVVWESSLRCQRRTVLNCMCNL